MGALAFPRRCSHICSIKMSVSPSPQLASPRRRPRQLALEFRTWGGKRAGAGRKPRGARAGVGHRARDEWTRPMPLHVTLRMAPHVYNLRSRRSFRVIEAALRIGGEARQSRSPAPQPEQRGALRRSPGSPRPRSAALLRSPMSRLDELQRLLDSTNVSLPSRGLEKLLDLRVGQLGGGAGEQCGARTATRLYRSGSASQPYVGMSYGVMKRLPQITRRSPHKSHAHEEVDLQASP